MSKNVSQTLPKTDSEAELLSQAVADLLNRISETWQDFDSDSLTATQAQALFLLTAAGMVERRHHLRLQMLNHPVMVEATFTATGEYGSVEALESLPAILWTEWEDAYRQWMSGEQSGTPPFHCERLKPEEWRLTDQGVIARNDLSSGQPAVVFDFVLKRGYFQHRKPVQGNGRLVKYDKSKQTDPKAVNIANWNEGGEAFAKAFSQFFAMQAGNIQKPAAGEGQEKVYDDPDQLLSAAKLADRLGIPEDDSKGRDAVRKRLTAWRKANFDGGWVEVRDRKPREPQFLYPLGKVWPVIKDMQRSG
jgi:hypothetical protein